VRADTSLPSPAPSASWQERCRAALQRAQRSLSGEDAAFASGRIRVDKNAIELVALVEDAEHMRFYRTPARFLVRVVEKRSKQPGELGGSVGLATDSQASVGFSRWTTLRMATLDAQVVGGARAFRFRRAFDPAVEECLR
jgi:hypothetical protein